MLCGSERPTFRKNIPPQCLRYKRKPSKKAADADLKVRNMSPLSSGSKSMPDKKSI
jgi:hypothetical protein